MMYKVFDSLLEVGMLQKLIRATLLFLLALTWSGCTQFTLYRTQTLAYDNTPAKTVIIKESKCYSGPPQQNLVACEDKETVASDSYAVQHRHYQYKNYRDENDKSGEIRN